MLLKTRVSDIEEYLHEHREYVNSKTRDTNLRIDNWGKQHTSLKQRFDDMFDELATNGVIRDIRQLQSELKDLKSATSTLIMKHDRQLGEVDVNRVHEEVFMSSRERSKVVNIGEAVTLAGKVEAIMSHLGLEIGVEQEFTTPSKVVARTKEVTKKGKK